MLKTVRAGDSGTAAQVARLLLGKESLTEQAIREFQTSRGLTADGVIGKETWTALARSARTVKRGSRGGAVSALQLLVNVDSDGRFGPVTEEALRVRQKEGGIAADGICGPVSWSYLITGRAAVFKPCPDYKQYDARWADKPYSATGDPKQTMRSSGCGPTAMADALGGLTGGSVTPYELAQFALRKGDRTKNDGTSHAFFTHAAEEYGLTLKKASSLTALKNCLDGGGYAVCSMGKGYWTKGGHFICAWKYDENDVYCRDPASGKRTKQKQSAFMKERKRFFCFTKGEDA